MRRGVRRRDISLYATPQELLDMEKDDPEGLRRRFKQALEHIDETGRLRPSDLQLPIFASPQYYNQPLKGYEGGAFDPEKLGVSYIVVPPKDGRGPNSLLGDWNLNPVPTPPLLTTHLPSSVSILLNTP